MTLHLKRKEQGGKSALQTVARTNGRLSKEKQQDSEFWGANLAVSWAAMLQSLLTQTKETEMNDLQTEKTSLTILLIFQGGRESLAESASRQILESPSIMIFVQPSAVARLMAQSTDAASAWTGRQLIYFLAQSLIGTPVWSLAITASAVDVGPTAASTLSLMIPSGGGDQEVGERGGGACIPHCFNKRRCQLFFP